jgi:hypothetical protein
LEGVGEERCVGDVGVNVVSRVVAVLGFFWGWYRLDVRGSVMHSVLLQCELVVYNSQEAGQDHFLPRFLEANCRSLQQLSAV